MLGFRFIVRQCNEEIEIQIKYKERIRKTASCPHYLNTSLSLPAKTSGIDTQFWTRGLFVCSILTIFTPTLNTPVPVIYDDAPKKKHSARRATWDGSRASSAVDQLLSSSKGFHGYGSSGEY